LIQILLYFKKSWTTQCIRQYLSSCGKFCLCVFEEFKALCSSKRGS